MILVVGVIVPKLADKHVHLCRIYGEARTDKDLGRYFTAKMSAMSRQSWISPYAPFMVRGRRYDLSHLNTFEHTYVQEATTRDPERTFVVIVDFSDHCFTESRKVGDDPALQYGPKKRRLQDERTFHEGRWERSMQLPDLILSLMGRKLFHNRDRDDTKIYVRPDGSAQGEYEVYINVRLDRTAGKIRLTVESAFVRDKHPQVRKGTVGFALLLYNASQGKMVRRTK